jgi:hypothetical protein
MAFITARMSGLRGRPPGGTDGIIGSSHPIPHPQVARTGLALVLSRSVDIAVQQVMPSRREAANFWGQFLRRAQVLCVVKHDLSCTDTPMIRAGGFAASAPPAIDGEGRGGGEFGARCRPLGLDQAKIASGTTFRSRRAIFATRSAAIMRTLARTPGDGSDRARSSLLFPCRHRTNPLEQET